MFFSFYGKNSKLKKIISELFLTKKEKVNMCLDIKSKVCFIKTVLWMDRQADIWMDRSTDILMDELTDIRNADGQTD